MVGGTQGTPQLGLDGGVGTPQQGLDGGGYPGTPQLGLYGGRVPGVPPHQDWMGYPPIRQSSIASTCYAADGVPLAFTQEDFLV